MGVVRSMRCLRLRAAMDGTTCGEGTAEQEKVAIARGVGGTGVGKGEARTGASRGGRI